jgi:putative transposase
MARGLVRYQDSGQSHFIPFSCYHRMQLLDESRLGLLLQALEQVRQNYSLRVYGYVGMPEHVHLLVSEPQAAGRSLATAIQALKLSVVRRARHADGSRVERLWQRRYYDHNVRNYQSFVGKLRYIHNNPVKRGLVQRAEDWRWSSACHYLSGELGPVEIESEWTARRREGRAVSVLAVPR